jgi:hypothetical protein
MTIIAYHHAWTGRDHLWIGLAVLIARLLFPWPTNLSERDDDTHEKLTTMYMQILIK